MSGIARHVGDASPGKIPLIGYALLIAAALVPRLILILLYPEAQGDAEIYLRVAHNILDNGCVSLSVPDSGDCAPHWGGNQLPGYPAFIAAAIWVASTISDERIAIGIAQSLVTAAAIARMAHVVGRMSKNYQVALVVGLVLALSPAHIAWSRLALTECLATATAIWFFAEIIASLNEGRLRVLSLSVTVGCAVLLRYDMILLMLPLIVAAIWLQGVRRGMAAIALIGVLAAIPAGAWGLRSVAVGLPFPPPTLHAPTEEPSQAPKGFNAWVHTWIHNQYELQTTLWPALTQDYSTIRVPNHAFDSVEERQQVGKLLEELSLHSGNGFPSHLDDQFGHLADQRRSANPWAYRLFDPAIRALWLWLNPITSLGWPSNPADIAQIKDLWEKRDVSGLVSTLGTAHITILGKALNVAYRYGLLFLVLFVSVRRLGTPGKHLSAIFAIALVHAAGRTLFFAYSPWSGPESRYIVEAYPAIEVALAFLLCTQKKKEGGNPPSVKSKFA